MIKVAIITVSDKGAAGEREDSSGAVIRDILPEIDGEEVHYEIIPDDIEVIREKLFSISENRVADLILTTGGTGFAPRDVTPEATLDVIEKEVPGLTEKMRQETGKITSRAYLSRGIAGIHKSTLIINFPGSPKAVRECLQAVIDILPHGIEILKGEITEHE